MQVRGGHFDHLFDQSFDARFWKTLERVRRPVPNVHRPELTSAGIRRVIRVRVRSVIKPLKRGLTPNSKQ